MSPSTCHGPDGVDLSREQAWILHSALLDHIERLVAADRSPDHAIDVLEQIETCDPLDTSDRRLAHDALSTYLDDAPERDRDPARAALESLQALSSQ